jgi:predicted porin
LAAFSGAAFAQSAVTLGGTYNFGVQKSNTGVKSADFFDAKVNFSGAEDLGGGLKASFSTEMQLGGRADTTTNAAEAAADATVVAAAIGNQSKKSNVWARNATVSLAGGFGTLTGGRVEGANLAQSAQLAGASLANGFDQASLAGANTNFNLVSYTSPAFNGFTVGVSQSKALNSVFATAADATNETTVTAVSASYAAGPLAAGFVNKSVNTAGTSADGKKNEMFATYDLGVAKVGLGYAKNSGAAYAGQKAQVIASVVAPVAANFTLGADYINRDGATAGTDSKGYAVAANYMLSKRTKINATMGKLTLAGVAGQSQYRVGLFHNF